MDGWLVSRKAGAETRQYNHADGSFTLETWDDVEPIIDRNKELQNTPQTKSDLMGNHIASIPPIILDRWAREDGAPHLLTMSKYEASKYLKKKLGDPNWRYLKTR